MGARITESRARRILSGHVAQLGGINKAARAWGVSATLVSRMVSGHRSVGGEVAKRIGLRRETEVYYVVEETNE